MGNRKTWAIALVAAGTLINQAPAQSIWQKMKQAAKPVVQNAEAQQRQTHAAQPARANAPAAASVQPAATAGSSPSGAPGPAADLSSSAMKALYRKLDVGGVQMGMTPKAAQAALQSRNQALAPKSNLFGFTDMPNTGFTSRIDFQQPGSMAEIVQLGLTLQPMQPEVLSISRYTRYNEHNVPTVANTIVALQAKYGPETARKIESNGREIILYWIFDGKGRLVPGNRATDPNQDMIGWCASGDVQLDVRNGLKNGGFPFQKFCAPLTVVRTELHEWEQTRKNSHGQSLPPGMLFQMNVTASSYPMLAKSVDATLKMLDAARNAHQQKEKQAAQQRAAPL